MIWQFGVVIAAVLIPGAIIQWSKDKKESLLASLNFQKEDFERKSTFEKEMFDRRLAAQREEERMKNRTGRN